MFQGIERHIISTLKPEFRRAEENTRKEYNALGAMVYLGIAVVSTIGLLMLPAFPFKAVTYCFNIHALFVVAYIKLRAPGFTLDFSVILLLFGLGMIVSLQAIMPKDMVYLTSFLYPSVFVFLYEFHTRAFTHWLYLGVLLASGVIVFMREIPYWDAYMVTAFGSTLIIGRVVGAAAAKLQQKADVDSLTGLMNRRHWEERLHHLMSLAERDGSQLTVAYLDIDHFKQINDSLGHAGGDAVLQNVSNKLSHVSREADLVGRWGGDEFGIAMPNTDAGQAAQLIERLQLELDEVNFSAGVVSMLAGEDLEGLLHRADHAMYQAKAKRKKVVVSGQTEALPG